MNISIEQYEEAIQTKNAAQKVIDQFHKEGHERFEERLKSNPVFTDDELIYSASQLCPCGHGLAYPKECGAFHYWDCSAILKGNADQNEEHCGRYPFSFYDIKSENERQGSTTTRGVFKPRAPKVSE